MNQVRPGPPGPAVFTLKNTPFSSHNRRLGGSNSVASVNSQCVQLCMHPSTTPPVLLCLLTMHRIPRPQMRRPNPTTTQNPNDETTGEKPPPLHHPDQSSRGVSGLCGSSSQLNPPPVYMHHRSSIPRHRQASHQLECSLPRRHMSCCSNCKHGQEPAMCCLTLIRSHRRRSTTHPNTSLRRVLDNASDSYQSHSNPLHTLSLHAITQ